MFPIVFEVFGTPQPAGSKRAVPWRAKDGRVGANLIDDNPKAKDWKIAVAAAAGQIFSGALLEGPLAVEFVFEVPRPAGHFGKRGLLPSAQAWPTTRPDALKLARAVEDALTGTLWRDDAQIVREILEKKYGERARLRVHVDRPENLAPTTWIARSFAVTASPEEQQLLVPEEASR